MLKNRVIPVLLLKDGYLVRSERFSTYQIIGDPMHEVKRFNEWSVDELIYLDISDRRSYTSKREDHKIKNLNDSLQILKEVSKTCFMPLAWGGGINTIDDIKERISMGADKVVINTSAVLGPDLISKSARIFGSQAIVVGVDVLSSNGKREVYINHGKQLAEVKLLDWVSEIEKLGAGEIFLNSIDRDGTGDGYDIELIKEIVNAVNIPVIVCGGVGCYEHYIDAIKAGASAVASANIWHFKEMVDKNSKKVLSQAGINVRL